MVRFVHQELETVRFVHIGTQIYEGDEHGFAFYDTVLDRFILVGGDYYFQDRKAFEEAVENDRHSRDQYDEGTINRFRNLIPEYIR